VPASGPRPSIVLFTRDLRVADHPALAAAVAAGPVVPLFVLDERILTSRYAAPNRLAHLCDALADLRAALRERGGDLVVRRGDPVAQVRRVCMEVGAGAIHLSVDVSAFAVRREHALRAMADELGIPVTAHPGVMLVPTKDVRATGGGPFQVFTPYWRRWSSAVHRAPLPAPERIALPTLPDGFDVGVVPVTADLTERPTAPLLEPGGERAARVRLDRWLEGPVDDYDTGRDLMGIDGTARLSPHLHLGTVSAGEVASRLDLRRPDHEAFLRQLCWRDFNHQLLADRPGLVDDDIRPRGDRWRDDPEALAAWKEGRTGYPLVDAGMRQLLAEGWMHNRARMVTASFLTKHLYIDWREGAWHFMDHLVDGDLANNFGQWQWTAGTGTDSRPNRIFNPVVQGQRYDPDGAYVRRWVPELAGVDLRHLHGPWEAAGSLFGATDYPAPIVDHREARERFLEARGR
jgi:deoxyribodipyrimidine photo-lyase